MKVPFLDLKKQYESIKDEIQEALEKVIAKTAFAGGPFVQQFEEEFARFCDTKYSIGVGSGTAALWVALLAMDVGSGDEIITAPNSFIATAEAISFTGAKPVFVDVDHKTYNLNPDLLEKARGMLSGHRLLLDSHVTHVGDDLNLIMTHEGGRNNGEVHQLAWDIFQAGTELAKKMKLGHKRD